MQVLVVEDDPALGGLIERGLRDEGHRVDLVREGHAGLEQGEVGEYDAIVLDLMLPGLDGIQLARRLRDQGILTPILMLTARNALHDRLAGFDAGADDYLGKPFAFAELLARLRAVSRRTAPPQEDQLAVDGLVLDRRAHEVTRDGNPVHLSPKEFALLEYLMMNEGQALSRTLILERVWDYGFDSFANVVDATVRRLRRAVDEGYDKQLIHTVRGVGYKIKA
jgi:DNA-binding response OmpR family regulator